MQQTGLQFSGNGGLPNSVPYIFTALHVSVPLAVITAVVSEYFAEYIIGVGRMIRENIVTAQYATAWAYIVIACALGIGMYLDLDFIGTSVPAETQVSGFAV